MGNIRGNWGIQPSINLKEFSETVCTVVIKWLIACVCFTADNGDYYHFRHTSLTVATYQVSVQCRGQYRSPWREPTSCWILWCCFWVDWATTEDHQVCNDTVDNDVRDCSHTGRQRDLYTPLDLQATSPRWVLWVLWVLVRWWMTPNWACSGSRELFF